VADAKPNTRNDKTDVKPKNPNDKADVKPDTPDDTKIDVDWYVELFFCFPDGPTFDQSGSLIK
jgi:hypothetical protein